MTYLSANLKMDRAMIREGKGTELENDDGATAAVVNLPAWSAGYKRQSALHMHSQMPIGTCL